MEIGNEPERREAAALHCSLLALLSKAPFALLCLQWVRFLVAVAAAVVAQSCCRMGVAVRCVCVRHNRQQVALAS